jgi:hypothetical protein
MERLNPLDVRMHTDRRFVRWRRIARLLAATPVERWRPKVVEAKLALEFDLSRQYGDRFLRAVNAEDI